ncbi:MAG: UDP-N-acetylglucosamine 1-carboxyvinyltransferase [Athalassotoga sp.]
MKAKIRGNSKIEGEVSVGGAKNSALPVLASLTLISKEVLVEKIPDISDVAEMISMIRAAGISVNFTKNIVTAKPSNLNGEIKGLGSKIRASILLLGPLAVRTGHSRILYPGGCPIGERPIDIHLEGLKKLGIDIKEEGDFIEAKFVKSPRDVKIEMRFPSVGATEHLMMTSVLLKGTTVEISNCAREPEVVDLGRFLVSMGAKISGIGTDRIRIEGIESLDSTIYSIIGDRIEAGTYMIGALSTGGTLKINGIGNEIENVVNFLKIIGSKIEVLPNSLIVYPSNVRGFHFVTGPYPEFPTDLQPQMALLGFSADGSSEIIERVFESRFKHVEELKKMGADISVSGNRINIRPSKLHGAVLVGNDLRETATVTFAAAIADGPSEIDKFEIIFRGYEKFLEKLKDMGIFAEIIQIDREVS